MRLDRLLATLGVGSRSEVHAMLRRGEVSLEGQAVTSPSLSIDPDCVHLQVRGALLDTRLQRHVMLHKPTGILTAARDRKQPTVMDLLPAVYASIGCMPVGRLDKDTTGLLLLTTDGELNHRLLSPERHVAKRYHVWVDGPLGAAEQQAFATGLHSDDFTARPAEMEILRSDAQEAEALVTVQEGQFHQIKRMFACVQRSVTRLHRCCFGPLALDAALRPGEWRELTSGELHALYAAVQMEES